MAWMYCVCRSIHLHVWHSPTVGCPPSVAGVFVLNHQHPETQTHDGLWWMALLPPRVPDVTGARYVPVEWCKEHMSKLGFQELSHVDVFEPLMNSRLDLGV